MLGLISLVLINAIVSFFFVRYDLTTEKRYTLSNVTKDLLNQLDDIVYVQVYLGKDEDFPVGFKRLRDATKEMLDEFKVYANGNVEFEFINVVDNTDAKQKKEIYKQLRAKGLEPTPLEVKTEGGTISREVWPGALVRYKGKDISWQLLKRHHGMSADMQLNNSIQAIEYGFASCIRNLSMDDHPKIGVLEGHGELNDYELADILNALSSFYDVKRVSISGSPIGPDDYKCLIIAKPDTLFTEKDKYVLDQYVMKGGKVLWVVDAMNTSVDSLRVSGSTVAVPYNLGIEDLLFKYGVRINQNLIIDLQASKIPVNKAFAGQEPRFELMPWLFSPLVMAQSAHPIVKNMEIVKFDFVSTMDTIKNEGVKKTILLTSSKHGKIINSPVRIDLRMAALQVDETLLTDRKKNLAVLLEGEFTSVFKNRVKPMLNGEQFLARGKQNKMIVISDGDVIRNELQYSTKKAYPLGYDPYTQQTYGNKNFILNCVNYLCDDSGLISVRSRDLTLRLLDKKKVRQERMKWQIINIVLPTGIILIFSLVYSYLRRRRFAN